MITPANRQDLDALPQSERAAFMAVLAGSLWQLRKDDALQQWVADETDSTVARYGFTRVDFPDAVPPALPTWQASEPTVVTVTPRQARLALEAVGLLTSVEAWIAAQPRAAQIDYEAASEWRSDWPLIEMARVALGWTHEKVYALFRSAQAL